MKELGNSSPKQLYVWASDQILSASIDRNIRSQVRRICVLTSATMTDLTMTKIRRHAWLIIYASMQLTPL